MLSVYLIYRQDHLCCNIGMNFLSESARYKLAYSGAMFVPIEVSLIW